jgi:hypothetical protein
MRHRRPARSHGERLVLPKEELYEKLAEHEREKKERKRAGVVATN